MAKKKVNKSDCNGCSDNFYNHRSTPGFDGETECWALASAVLMKRKCVPVGQPPPWEQESRMFPSCYRRKGYVYINDDQRWERKSAVPK